MNLQATIDPIDTLIPPPLPAWVRLVLGAAVILTAVVGSVLWAAGFVYPRPDCCGSGSGGAEMKLSDNGKAVDVTAMFVNSSGRDLRISSAKADLRGATVLGIAILDENDIFVVSHPKPFPAVISGTQTRQLVITFVPTTCHDDDQAWGKVSVRLNVANSHIPSVGRTYTLQTPVVDEQQGVSVFQPQSPNNDMPATPLAAACALLGH
jgi:hypothetical protein